MTLDCLLRCRKHSGQCESNLDRISCSYNQAVFMDHVCEGGEHGTGIKFDGFDEGEKAILKKVKNQWVSLEVAFHF